VQKTSKPRPPETSANNFRELRGEPIFIPYDPHVLEENPLPSENPARPGQILVVGSLVALLCAWWFAPEQMQMLWGKLLNFLFH
jgi:hypothetical protein